MISITKAALRFAAPFPDIERYERFLFIGPHPDDIEIGAGATAAKLAARGKQLCFLVCTDGRYGSGNAPADMRGAELARLREREARKSAAELGVHDVRFLGLCDGGFYDCDALVREIALLVGSFQPQVVFAPDPCVSSECHIDHLNVGNAARRIACFAPYGDVMEQYGAAAAPVEALAYYMSARTNRFVKTSGYFETQLRSIFSCHLSQFPPDAPETKALRMYLRLRALDFGLRSGKGCAEGFRVLGPTHMHCLPEAGL